VRSAVGITSPVDGFTWVEGTRKWRVEGKLAENVRSWKEQDQLEQERSEDAVVVDGSTIAWMLMRTVQEKSKR